MSLATVDADGRPHCRILLLKALDDRGFTFFTNYDSAKGQQLDASPYAAMTFFWPTLERQVRIEGRVEKVTAEESDAYFQVRPLGSRLGAWASPQSQVIRDRAELERLLAETEQRFLDKAPLSSALGRLPAAAGAHRVLAGAAEPPARPTRLSPGRQWLAARAPGALIRSLHSCRSLSAASGTTVSGLVICRNHPANGRARKITFIRCDMAGWPGSADGTRRVAALRRRGSVGPVARANPAGRAA